MDRQIEILLTEACPKCENGEGLQIFGFGGEWWVQCPKCRHCSDWKPSPEEAQEEWNRDAVKRRGKG